MSDAKKDGLDGILHAMRYGPIPPHKHDRELLRYYAAKLDEALKREGNRRMCPVNAKSCNLRRLFERDPFMGAEPKAVNGAALVSALQYAIARAEEAQGYVFRSSGPKACMEELINACSEALHAPARPCDKYGSATAAMAELKRRHHECAEEGHPCREDCPDCGKEKCAITWLMSPEKGGEP